MWGTPSLNRGEDKAGAGEKERGERWGEKRREEGKWVVSWVESTND